MEGGRVRIRREDGTEAEHAGAVVALPPAETARVCELPDAVAGFVASAPTRRCLSVALVLDRPAGYDWFGLSFSRREPPGDVLAAICNMEAKPGGLVPEGKGGLVVFPAPSRVDSLAGRDAGEVVDTLLPAVERALPGVSGHVVRARVYPFAAGSTQFPAGRLRELAALDMDALPPGLALAGDYLAGPTIEGAVRSGVRAAERLLRSVTS